ncbi:glycosyltransferase family 4 protein [Paenibacillus beijingensis]|uniref:Glycosyl transferase family 1 n=1 Tax=Paenibacillus beijingensis TaxID=1126833 RepID=A0A0D5NL42_9BACL|nr:glycosyltransferase family 4 protein [Paenibacillus beijingensis]AJY75712.1 hypothetical protein VN24_15570 [Paenibacillus beijingensis]
METRKQNVLYITHADKKGGAEQSLIHLVNFMDRRKYSVFLLSPKDANYLHEIRSSYVHFPLTLNSIKKRLGFGYLQTVLRIRKFVKQNNIDIIHANGWRAPWYAAPLKFGVKSKLVWHHRDHTHLRMYNKVLPRFFNQVICISHFVASSIQGSNKTVIYNGVDPGLALADKTRKFMEDGTLVIGTFGRIVEWKRYHLVVEALKKLSEQGIRAWQLIIVGDTSVDGSDDYFDGLKQQVQEAGLEDKVIFYGYSKKPLDVMAKCDVTINFSHNEPFGRVIIESMLMKTPVIVSDSGGAPEIIQRTGGGLIVKDGDTDELALALRSIYENDVDYEQLAAKGYAWVMEKFNMDTIAGEVSDLYRSLSEYGFKPEERQGTVYESERLKSNQL